jgi:hypothetical protein
MLDLKDGFYNIPMAENSKKFTSFTIPSGKYAGKWEFNQLCQGLKNASSTLQRFMDGLLHNLSPMIVLCYIDDLVIFSETIEQNIDRLRQVLERLNYGNLTININKCQFAVESIIFLGYLIEQNSVKADPRLIEKIKNFDIPTNILNVMAWNGLSGYYRSMIKNYAEINRPISDLLKNHNNNLKKKVIFTQECIDAFNKIKNIMISEPFLIIADPAKEFRLCVDTSGYATGAVLEQLGEDKKYHPVGYASRKLSPREQAESASVRELIGFVYALKHYKFYLYGQKHFTVIVDNAALKYLLTMKNPNSKLLRMAMEISDYNFTVQHRAGKTHTNADSMSRFVNNVNISVFTMDDLQRHQERDDECFQLSKKEKFSKKDGILWFNSVNGPRAVIPKSLRATVLKQEHDSILAGHCGKDTTNKKIASQYYWPNRQHDVEFYCTSCEICSARRLHDKTKMPLVEMPQPTEPFEFVGIDITQLPATAEYQYILTIVCFFSRFLIMVPMKNQEASTVAKAFVENFALKYNIPKFLHSDQGRQFESNLFAELCKLLQIKKLRTSPMHPACNGKTEVTHKFVKRVISSFCGKNQFSWPKLLQYAVCVHNTKPHYSTKKSPYEIVYGRPMRSPFNVVLDNMPNIENEEVKDLAQKLHKIWNDVYQNNHQAFLKYARAHDKKARAISFEVGDEVWLHDLTLKKHETKKLAAPYKGPFPVNRILSAVNTEIKLPNRLVVVHNNRLKLAKKRVDTAVYVCPQDLEPQDPMSQSYVDAIPSTSGTQPNAGPKPPKHKNSAPKKRKVELEYDTYGSDSESDTSEHFLPLQTGKRATKGRTVQGFYKKFT